MEEEGGLGVRGVTGYITPRFRVTNHDDDDVFGYLMIPKVETTLLSFEL